MKKYPQEYYLFFDKFNQAEYYECHDLLEEIWLTDRQNNFLKGLLQFAVGFYHYGNGNINGTRLMFSSAKNYLEKYLPRYWDLNLEPIITYIKEILPKLPLTDKIPYEKAKENPLPVIKLDLNSKI